MYDISRKSKIYIRNISSLMQKYGVITGIIPFYDDIIIAFRANGLVRLRTSKKYEAEVVKPQYTHLWNLSGPTPGNAVDCFRRTREP